MEKYIYALLLLLSINLCAAQSFQGKVINQDNTPISDVLIYAGSHHCHTDAQGLFNLKDCQVGDTIQMSLLGYEPMTKILSSKDLDEKMVVVLQEATFDLSQVTVSSSVKNINVITAIDLRTNPVYSAQEVLRKVPGLMISQHAGGGKAEQIFLRGFDIDHGTDVAITVDGMPGNMVSHAHGQGYADLHFIIPETIENIDFGKGPYYADHGNFNTAGYVDFKTKDKLDRSMVGVEYGRFNSSRLFTMIDLLGGQEKQNAYVATEYLLSDGPVESPQNFNRFNVLAKYNIETNSGDRISAQFSRFQSKWDASGQIPQRLVDDGTITRFGAVDNTEGGQTSRTNFAINHNKILDENRFIKTSAYYSQYNFELYSNFTFFLEDSINGDQIKQFEDRNIYGLQSTLFQKITNDNFDLDLSYGLGLRYDDVNNNELSRTANRKTTLENLSLGDVDETNLNAFINAEFDFGKWLINPGLRFDAFSFDYIDRLSPQYDSRSVDKAAVSPKLNIVYNPNLKTQFYLKTGMGFHSNDTRVVVAQDGKEILPAAYGADLGTIWKPLPRLWFNFAAWYLFLEQEFVYVGDAAIVEPSGESTRRGIDIGFRYQIGNNLFIDADATYAHARTVGEDGENVLIPLAVELMSSGGLTYKHPNGFSGSLRYRYVKDRPANEDNSIVAEGFFVVDANVSYKFKNITIGIIAENLLDTDWNEAQFATESRLRNETEPVEEIHFTPGVPFFMRGSIKYEF